MHADVNNPKPFSLTIAPDARAYLVVLIALSPLFLLWGLVWLRGDQGVAPPVALVAGVVVIGLTATIRIDRNAPQQE
jgi:hypothetical protein